MMTAQWLVVALVFTVHAIDMFYWTIVVVTSLTVALQIPAIGSVMLAMPMLLTMLVVMAMFNAV